MKEKIPEDRVQALDALLAKVKAEMAALRRLAEKMTDRSIEEQDIHQEEKRDS